MTCQSRSEEEVDVEMAIEQTEGLVSLGPLEPYIYLKMGRRGTSRWTIVMREEKNVRARWDVCGAGVEIQSEEDDPAFHVIMEPPPLADGREPLAVGDGQEHVNQVASFRGLSDLTAAWTSDGRTIELRSLRRPELDLDIRFLGKRGQRGIHP